jgi:hypothetical protein
MTREEFRKFLRAMVATLIAGCVTWALAKMGVHISVPQP